MFKVKENPNDSINKYKARLDVNNFPCGETCYYYTKTFFPMVKPVTMHTILNVVSQINGLHNKYMSTMPS